MHERIKRVREEIAGMSQRAFAQRIGITGSSIALLESGKNNPSEQTIRAICREFNISRSWLETGKGEPQLPDVEDDMIVSEVLRGEDESSRQSSAASQKRLAAGKRCAKSSTPSAPSSTRKKVK